ncbi:mannosyl-oligosaccharide 1,2-alpha-mannosidase IA-like [Callospermophilus lateralis]|uniref:mannosyl-oligosaccharide 1,2-alpha-mannosidase IA-like n=1 Tax=Callospermophilus lateralis TaxID=76772 RepID=UPI0040389833
MIRRPPRALGLRAGARLPPTPRRRRGPVAATGRRRRRSRVGAAAAPPLPRTRRGSSVAAGGGSSAPTDRAAAAPGAQVLEARLPFGPTVEGAASELRPAPGACGAAWRGAGDRLLQPAGFTRRRCLGFPAREEEERLRNKIQADHEKALEEAKEKLRKSKEEIRAEIQTEKNKVAQEIKTKEKKPLPPVPIPNLVGISDGEPEDSDIRKKREKIKEMMKHAWDNYRTYGWGHNELRPIARKGHSTNIFGSSQMGATIVDALDTLYIMGLHDEFLDGQRWIEDNLDFSVHLQNTEEESTWFHKFFLGIFMDHFYLMFALCLLPEGLGVGVSQTSHIHLKHFYIGWLPPVEQRLSEEPQLPSWPSCSEVPPLARTK